MKKVKIDGVEYAPIVEQKKLAKKNKDGLEYCIIRTYSAGVWAGWIDTKNKNMCQEVYNARRLWRWWSNFTLSELSKSGMQENHIDENKYAEAVDRVILKEIIEIIPCTEKAKKQIENQPNYKENE